jgi:putative transposase
MKKTQFTEEQIAYALHEGEIGTLVADICRKLGVSEQTFYRWKKKFAGMGVAELQRLKPLEDENRKLKHLVADLPLTRKCSNGMPGSALVCVTRGCSEDHRGLVDRVQHPPPTYCAEQPSSR